MNNLITINKLINSQMGSEERKNLEEEFAKEYSRLFLALYGEIAKYRYRSTEKAAEDELRMSIWQVILNMEKQPE